MDDHGWIDAEADWMVCPGDWIVTDPNGEHHPCKPLMFAATYEPTRTPGFIECCPACGEPRFYENGDKGSDGGCASGFDDGISGISIKCPIRTAGAEGS
jgi:hypothetical protein